MKRARPRRPTAGHDRAHGVTRPPQRLRFLSPLADEGVCSGELELMNTIEFRNKLHLGLAGIFLAGLSAHAQIGGPSAGPAGLSGGMAKLFGDISAFSAKADVQVLDSSKQEMVSMPMDFAMLDKNI